MAAVNNVARDGCTGEGRRKGGIRSYRQNTQPKTVIPGLIKRRSIDRFDKREVLLVRVGVMRSGLPILRRKEKKKDLGLVKV